jgi:Spy/CpxP family protein refolding chaperone
MKQRIYILISVVLLSCYTSSAQQDDTPAAPAKLMGLQMSFITKQLALTNDEAQKFWPVYYSYKADLRKAKKSSNDDVLAVEENTLNVRKKYRAEFKKILNSDDRVNKALTVDRDFVNVVKKELQERRRAKGINKQ